MDVPTRRSKPIKVANANTAPEPSSLDDAVSELPPHSPEAEQGVLGCILLSPEDCLPVCITSLKGGVQMFYELRHQIIYDACVTLWDQQKKIDLIVLHQVLKDSGKLDGIGGLAYLASIPDMVPSAANLEHYIEILREKYIRRQMLSASAKIAQSSRDATAKVMDALSDASNVVQKVADAAITKAESHPVKNLIGPAIEHIEELLKGGKVTISTGFPDLDELTWGLQPGEMAVLAARPSVGKTALAMNIGEHLSMNGISVGVFSLEMSKESLIQRLLCARARINHHDIRKGMLSADDQSKLMKAATDLTKAKLHIDDSSGLSILELRARARRMFQQLGCRVFIIDYLQLMTARVRGADNRQNEVALISSGIKGLAKELQVPVLVLSQLSRKMEDRGNNSEPKLSDLRESGSIEQDADMVILMHKLKDKNEQHESSATLQVQATVAKNRNGPTGKINLLFLKYCTRFESIAKEPKINPEDIPSEQKDLIL